MVSGRLWRLFSCVCCHGVAEGFDRSTTSTSTPRDGDQKSPSLEDPEKRSGGRGFSSDLSLYLEIGATKDRVVAACYAAASRILEEVSDLPPKAGLQIINELSGPRLDMLCARLALVPEAEQQEFIKSLARKNQQGLVHFLVVSAYLANSKTTCSEVSTSSYLSSGPASLVPSTAEPISALGGFSQGEQSVSRRRHLSKTFGGLGSKVAAISPSPSNSPPQSPVLRFGSLRSQPKRHPRQAILLSFSLEPASGPLAASLGPLLLGTAESSVSQRRSSQSRKVQLEPLAALSLTPVKPAAP